MSSVFILAISTGEKISRLFRGSKHKPSYQTLCDIVQKFPALNLNWLITGEGQMLHQKQSGCSEGKETDFIPLYDGVAAENRHLKFWEEEEHILDVIPKKFGMRDCDAAIHIYGNSMYPLYMPGDIILLKEIKEHSLVSYGRVYVVITEEHRFIKYIMPASDSACLLLRSENKHYDDIEIEKLQIIKLYQVQGSFRRTGI